MPNKIVKTMLQDGPSKAVLSVYMESDGNEGELTNFVLLDPQVDFSPPLDPSAQMSITQVWCALSWFDALLSFDDLVPYPSWNLPRDADNYHDLRYFGGLKDRSGMDHTGKLFITTNGFAPLGSIGTLIIELKKN